MKLNSLLVGFLLFSVGFAHAQSKAFTPESLWELKQLGGEQVSPDNKQIIYRTTTYDVDQNQGHSEYSVYNVAKKTTEVLTGEVGKISGLRWINNEVAGIVVEGDEKKVVRTELNNPSLKVVLSRPKNTLIDFKFSPEENYIITLERVKTRESIADLYPDYDKANVKIYDDLMYRHWDQWQDEYSKQLILYPIKDGKVSGEGKNLLEGTPYHGVMVPFGGLGDVIFIGESKVVYTTKKMTGKEFATSTDSDLYAYDIQTGETSNLTGPYLGYDMHPRLHEKTQQLGWLSMASEGFEADKTDIIVRDLKTQEDRNLTSTIDLTVSTFVWNNKGDKIYFIAVTEATYQYFELDVKTGKHRQITHGDHDYRSISTLGNKLVGMKQTMLHPNELYEVDIKSGNEVQFTFANDEFLSSFEEPTIEKRWITTSDQKKMLTWVILPPNFSEENKYPTLLYCQGGPQSAVSQFFSLRWNFRLMASQGYIVVAPNRRGLPGFGQQWNNAISKDWGGQPMRDYLAAIDEVSKEKYVDKSRRGAVGASYGGYSVYYLAGIHEGRFSSFISHAGLFNMTSWYGTTEELFFANWDVGGPYWDKKNDKSYVDYSPHTLVNKWDTPILIFHGGRDYRVPKSQGFEAYQAAQLKGLKSRLVYFPEENHWILSPHNAMIWQNEFYKWLNETLD